MAKSAMFAVCILLTVSRGHAYPPGPSNRAQTTTSGNGCFPNNPVVKPIDPLQRTGLWYNFMFLGNHSLRIEDHYISNPLGWVPVPGTTTQSLLTSTIISWWTSPNTNQCAGQFVQMYMVPDGREIMLIYDTTSPIPTPLTSNAMYDDTIMQIRYFCTQPGQNGICENTNIFLNTRKHPLTLSDADKAYIRDKANAVLSPYCMGFDSLLVESWIPGRPMCSAQPWQSYLDLIQGLAAGTTPTPS